MSTNIPTSRLRASRWLASTMFGVFGAACSAPTDTLESGGDVEIGVSASALSSADVTRVSVTITGPGIATPIVRDLSATPSTDQWVGIVSAIPVGTDRAFDAVAYDASGTAVYGGQASGITITRNNVAQVAILLQQLTPPDPFRNNPPNILAVLTQPRTPAPGDVVTISVQAVDPDAGDTLTYAWLGTAGTFANPAAAATTWTAPATDGTYALTISVRDQKHAGRSVTINIEVAASRARGKALIIASFNTWPEVTAFSADPALVAPGATAALAVVGNDNDADPITFALSDDCGGSFVGTASWTAPMPAPASGACTLTAVASDGRGGTGSGIITVLVGDEVPPNFGPVFVDGYQSHFEARIGDTLSFEATAEDDEGDAITFSWTASQGTLSAINTVGNVTSAQWTSAVPQDAIIIVRATDAAGNFAEEAFTVATLAFCGNGVPEVGELCDGNCPSCDDGVACTTDANTGSAATCNLACSNTPITACLGGDGCCAPGCNANDDSDCSPSCGNGVTEAGETCDGNCPASCDDGVSCTTDTLSGSAASCSAACSTMPVTACASGDGCCAPGCNSINDDDCAPICGNSIIEAGEVCDGNCPTSCSDGVSCTTDTLTGSAANCDAACSFPQVTACANGDGCCPAGCVNANDNDCAVTAAAVFAPTCNAGHSCSNMVLVRATQSHAIGGADYNGTWSNLNGICATYGHRAPTVTAGIGGDVGLWDSGVNPGYPVTSDTFNPTAPWMNGTFLTPFPGGRVWIASGAPQWLSRAVYPAVATGSTLTNSGAITWESYHPQTGGNWVNITSGTVNGGDYVMCAQ